jgi:hypothetical protein
VFSVLYGYAVFVSIGSLAWPLARDQGVYAWVGDVIVNGGVPYADAWEVKGPATHYTYAFAQWLFGRTLWAIRVIDLGFLALALATAFRILRRHTGSLAAHAGVLLFAYLYLDLGYWDTSQPDGWAGLLLVPALALVVGDGRLLEQRPGLARSLAGALVGTAALYKVTFFAFLLVFAVCEAVRTSAPPGLRLRRISQTAAASVAVFGLALCWLAWRGALDEFLDIQLGFNSVVHHAAFTFSVGGALRNAAAFFARPGFAALLPLVAFGLWDTWQRQRSLAVGLAGLLAMGTLIVAGQFKFYPYHWVPIYAPLALLAALGAGGLAQRLREWKPSRARLAPLAASAPFALLAFAVFQALPPADAAAWSTFSGGAKERSAYHEAFGRYGVGDFSFRASAEAARYLRERTSDGAPVLMWGFESLVNYLAGRPSPTRFGFNYPLVASAGTGYQTRYRREFMRDLEEREAAYVVIMDWDQNNLMPRTSRQYLKDFEQFDRYLRENYDFEKKLEHFYLWRRKQSR